MECVNPSIGTFLKKFHVKKCRPMLTDVRAYIILIQVTFPAKLQRQMSTMRREECGQYVPKSWL